MTDAAQTISPTQNSLGLSKREIAQIVWDRRQARKNFIDYCRYIAPDEPPALHHVKLGEKLQEIVDGTLKNLMVFMPPGSAKSTYCSVRFPSYYLGRFPTKDLIQCSNTAELASRFGRKTRNLLDTKRFRTLFDVSLAKDSQAKNQWEVIPHESEEQNGGEYYATGVEGAVTGRRADGGLIDDPVKGQAEANSETIREKQWDWYLTDFITRLKPSAWKIIIQTRWHEDDLSGRILPDDWDGQSGYVTTEDGETWYVLCISAEAGKNDVLGRKPGEWLWPEWFTGDFWQRTKDRLVKRGKSREWFSLYQQTPTPDDGIHFKRDDLLRYVPGDQPEHLHRYATGDFAVTEKTTADFTAFGDWGIDSNNEWWLLDGYHDQSESTEWVAVLAGKKQSDGSISSGWFKSKPLLRFIGEGGVIRRAVEPWLKKTMREHQQYCAIEWINKTQDKVAMAAGFIAMCRAQVVHFPLSDFGDKVVEELVSFNSGKHDDLVDMCGMIGLAVDHGIAATIPSKGNVKPKSDDYGINEPDEVNIKIL